VGKSGTHKKINTRRKKTSKTNRGENVKFGKEYQRKKKLVVTWQSGGGPNYWECRGRSTERRGNGKKKGSNETVL